MQEQILEKLSHIEQLALLGAKNVLTIDDAALITGFSKQALYRLTSNSEIPYYRPRGKFLYFDKKELEDWMRQGRVITKDEARNAVANDHLTKK